LLDSEGSISRACLVRKRMEYLPKQPMFVLGIDVEKKLLQTDRVAINRKIVQNLVKNIKLAGPVYIFVVDGNFQLLGRALAKVPGSTILNRSTGT
jgi:hypothetical protein